MAIPMQMLVKQCQCLIGLDVPSHGNVGRFEADDGAGGRYKVMR